eukprot:CCRYP_012489-RA/>CCRYP_012489-RA protein AED:0.24 eAED:0.18 QI:0/0/0/1/0/0/3/0/206
MTLFTTPPTVFHNKRQHSVLLCLELNTRIDINKFMFYSKFLSDEVQDWCKNKPTLIAQCDYSTDFQSMDSYNNIADQETAQPPQKKKKQHKYVMARQNDDGELEHIPPMQSFWYVYYVQNSSSRESSEECKASNLFNRWMSCDALGQQPTPLELVFFGQFIEFGSIQLYNKYIAFPTNFEEAKEHMKEFTVASLPGSLGSMDAYFV